MIVLWDLIRVVTFAAGMASLSLIAVIAWPYARSLTPRRTKRPLAWHVTMLGTGTSMLIVYALLGTVSHLGQEATWDLFLRGPGLLIVLGGMLALMRRLADNSARVDRRVRELEARVERAQRRMA